jgi:pyrimidine operon attenuation protein/uracil phosphoribosyltransferase
VAYASSALGEVQRIVAEAQILYPWTAREIRSALEEVIAICRKAQAELQPLAERRDRDVALASLSDGEKVPYTDTSTQQERTPWWKFWKRE